MDIEPEGSIGYLPILDLVNLISNNFTIPDIQNLDYNLLIIRMHYHYERKQKSRCRNHLDFYINILLLFCHLFCYLV